MVHLDMGLRWLSIALIGGTALGFANSLDTSVLAQTIVTSAAESSGVRAKDEHWGESRSGNRMGREVRIPECTRPEHSLTVLVPHTNWGLTASETLTLWFYNPYSSDNLRGSFYLIDEERYGIGDPIELFLPNTAGYVSFTLPKSIFTLEPGVTYYWTISVPCSSELSDDISSWAYASGWLQYVLLDTEQQAQHASDRPDYQRYWTDRIWFDAVHELTQLRLIQPQNESLMNEWLRLLEDGGFNAEFIPVGPILGPVQWVQEEPELPDFLLESTQND